MHLYIEALLNKTNPFESGNAITSGKQVMPKHEIDRVESAKAVYICKRSFIRNRSAFALPLANYRARNLRSREQTKF